jgi:glycosyltransferase involved in cell wall biosynthesis
MSAGLKCQIRSSRPFSMNDLSTISQHLNRVVFYDVTRLVKKRNARVPSDVDRIDFAILDILSHDPSRVIHPVVEIDGKLLMMPADLAEGFLHSIRRCWTLGAEPDRTIGSLLERTGLAINPRGRFVGLHHGLGGPGATAFSRTSLQVLRTAADSMNGISRSLTRLGGKLRRSRYGHALEASDIVGATYLVASHDGAPARAGLLARLKRAGLSQIAVYLHDTIPLDFPEYATLASIERFKRYFDEVGDHCDTYFVNSSRTEDDLRRRLGSRVKSGHIHLAYPSELVPTAVRAPDPQSSKRAPGGTDAPYFITVGTIEPRKNHLLLLNLWRRLAADRMTPMPKLHIVGRRGWLNDGVTDLLDRCSDLQPHVIEHNSMGDDELCRLMQGATAMLLPSFVEGFCLPAVEARSFGVPVLSTGFPCDELGTGERDIVLDPLDGLAWYAAIRRLTTESLASMPGDPMGAK